MSRIALPARRIQAVLFDMDGTLLDSANTVPAAYAAAIRELGGADYSTEEVIAHYGAGPAGALMAAMLGRETTDDDVERFHVHLARRLDGTRTYPGIRQALQALVAAGLLTGVFTGATHRAAEMQLDHAGLLGLFHVVVGSDEIGAVKPSPEGIRVACSRLGIPPTLAAYVGDAPNDLLCARAAGAVAVAAGWGHLFEPSAEADVTLAEPGELVQLGGAGRSSWVRPAFPRRRAANRRNTTAG
jgi:phosphoglycolate phosphatase-like HAD superfamily hydrolase